MSSPILWIIFPSVLSVALWFFRYRRRTVMLVAGTSALLLSLLALAIPIDKLTHLGAWSFELSSTLELFGRRFVLSDNDRPLLVFLYLLGAFWLFGALVTDVYRNFAPLAFGILTLLIAALAVEPFLYAALLVEVAVLLSVPMLLPSDRKVGQGVLRYLIFQTLAVPCILLAGWLSGAVEANPADIDFLTLMVGLLGMGFSLWLAVFPFHSWVPLLSSEIHPYVSGLVLCLMPAVIFLQILDFLNAFIWLREFDMIFIALRVVGVVMVVFGGALAAFQTNLGSLFGYGVLMCNGFGLLAISLGNRLGFEILVMSFLPRTLAMGLWAMSITVLTRGEKNLSFDVLRGLLRSYPVASGALVVAYFSMAGLPFLAGFPLLGVWLGEMAKYSISTSMWVLIGYLGFLLSGFRVLAVIAGSQSRGWKFSEGLAETIFMILGALGLLIVGIMPGWIFSQMQQLLGAFQSLSRF